MDQLEQALREEFTGSLALTTDEVLTGVARRRTRRRLTTLGSAVAVCAVLAATVMAQNTPEPGPPPGPAMPRPAWPAHFTPTAGLDSLQALAVADPDHLFLLLATPDRADHTSVPYSLSASEDGGRTWQDRSTPPVTLGSGRNDFPVALRVAGVGTLEIDTINQKPTRRWVSTDGGGSWAERPATPTATVDEIPVGATAFVQDDAPSTPALPGLLVLSADGTLAWLATPPTGVEFAIDNGRRPRVLNADDGSLWLTATVDDGTVPAAVISRDRGRTWQTLRLPGSAGPQRGKDTWVTTRTGLTAIFASLRPTAMVHIDAMGAARPVPLPATVRVMGGVAPLPDGSAWVTEQDRGILHWVDPLGVAVTPVPDAPPVQEIAYESGRYFAVVGEEGSRSALTSLDGLTWVPLTMG